MDIFSFMKGKDIEIDVQSEWFQDLWYPMSNRTHVLGSMRVLSWLGYEGEYFIKQRNFKKLLSNNSIPYEEVDYNDERFREHEVMIKEIADTDPKVVKNKRWIVMTVRHFKKAVRTAYEQ
jgi:glutaredoxin